MKRLKTAIDAVVEEIAKTDARGTPSQAVPALAGADTGQFGIAVHTCEGETVSGAAADTPFTIQSISKVFSLTLALEAHGDDVWTRVGREPSGDPFNSIVDLERHEGIPRNPFINAGALVVIDMLLGKNAGKASHDSVRAFLEARIGADAIGIDDDVANEEQSSGFVNRALANLAKSFDNLDNEVETVMKAYVEQCALTLSCEGLARAGAYLMSDRADQHSDSVAEARRARRINALMLTCGQYDGSGEFAYRVGLPAKSGVGGGILAIVPNEAAIAVWSPGLDDNGNSLLGTRALELLAEKMDWSVFGSIERR
ncbi:glutaminase [Arsenicitalea aurantiaca]|uniref:Glutaminase n=2 Tax=Arsenicitalea aurantiaca TaxID=1783274 RepID=A0A433XMD4_9HYPH|nr:glutaminase [Arsenicitalea aurantiaca]